jgi:hypothetical protein
MRQGIGMIFVLVLGVAGAVAQEAAKDEKAKDYYPLNPGMKWFYKMYLEGRTLDVEIQVKELVTLDGQSLALVERKVTERDSKDDKVKQVDSGTEHMSANEKGVFRYRVNGIALSPPMCLLKYPFKAGETWETESTMGSEQLKIKGKAIGIEEVEVNEKKYQAHRADIDTTGIGNVVSSSYWFAPDVGLVKQVMKDGRKEAMLELIKFDSGRDEPKPEPR